ncbi:hypothetical protein KIN20_028498 [Parelaphostrongylus tenuis]|uniref:Uncharacterized protein n=1 Tax=Parelaphostrongylus tenuis TaxID=148309 RepID=A0AAD5R110_PARTN|nr:hypothetical protein KIN20_028498 [Parelaphostrongylus tenuis]
MIRTGLAYFDYIEKRMKELDERANLFLRDKGIRDGGIIDPKDELTLQVFNEGDVMTRLLFATIYFAGVPRSVPLGLLICNRNAEISCTTWLNHFIGISVAIRGISCDSTSKDQAKQLLQHVIRVVSHHWISPSRQSKGR